MAEQPEELKELMAASTNMVLPVKIRANAIESIGNMGTHDALLALLNLAANGQLTRKERALALKWAEKIVKSGD